MNVEIGAEAALYPEKDYIRGIFVAVQYRGFSCSNDSFINFYLPVP